MLYLQALLQKRLVALLKKMDGIVILHMDWKPTLRKVEPHLVLYQKP